MVKNVLVIMAMTAEAAPLIARLSLTKSTTTTLCSTINFALPYESYEGTFNETTITLLTSGKCGTHGVDNVGTLHAGMMTMYALRELQSAESKYDLVVNAGTCGGFISRGCKIGSVCIPEHTSFHDRRINIPGTPFEAYGHGKITIEEGHMATSVRSYFSYLGGGVTTGDSLDHTKEDMEIMKKHSSTVKDMEAAAISQVCKLAGVEYLGVKVVTDLIDGDRPAHEEFMENLGKAAESLQENVPKIIEYLANKSD